MMNMKNKIEKFNLSNYYGRKAFNVDTCAEKINEIIDAINGCENQDAQENKHPHNVNVSLERWEAYSLIFLIDKLSKLSPGLMPFHSLNDLRKKLVDCLIKKT